MIAKLQFLLGFEITFGHKSSFQVTFREQLEPCFSSVSLSGLKRVGRSVAAPLHAQEMSCWWQAVVSSESPFTCPQLLLENCWVAWILQPCPWGMWSSLTCALCHGVENSTFHTKPKCFHHQKKKMVVLCWQQCSGLLSDCRWPQIMPLEKYFWFSQV